jgi:integrase
MGSSLQEAQLYSYLLRSMPRDETQDGFDLFSWPYVSSTKALVLTLSAKTKSKRFHAVITATLKLWRRYHLTYDQTRYVAKEVRRALAIARPPTRQRVITWLSRAEEEALIRQAYRMPGIRGLLIKTLFQTGARVSEFVHLQVADVYFDEQMLLLTHVQGGKQCYGPLLPERTHELRTYCGIARQRRCLPPMHGELVGGQEVCGQHADTRALQPPWMGPWQ